MEIIAF